MTLMLLLMSFMVIMVTMVMMMSLVMTMVILMMLMMISVHWDQTSDRRPFTPVFLFPAVPMILANTSPLPLITFYITFLSLFSSSFFLSLFHFFSVSYSLFSVSFIFLFCLLYDHFFFCFFDTLILIVLPPTMSKILAKSSDAFSCSQFGPNLTSE